MRKMFTDHPASVGESYGEHMVSALSFAGAMLKGTICCFIHAFLPFLFETTGRRTISDLHTRMVTNRAEETPRRRRAAGLPVSEIRS